MYTVNTLTIAYLFNYLVQRLNFQVGIGWGLTYGHIATEDYNEYDNPLMDFEFTSSNTLVLGGNVGLRLIPNWRLSLYVDHFEVLDEVEMCDFYSDTCRKGTVPGLTQSGLRLSWTH